MLLRLVFLPGEERHVERYSSQVERAHSFVRVIAFAVYLRQSRPACELKESAFEAQLIQDLLSRERQVL